MAESERRPLIVVVASDKFRGTLSGHEAAWCLARGAMRAGEREAEAVRVIEYHMADGGEGFADAAGSAGQDAQAVWLPVRDAGGATGSVRAPAMFGWREAPNPWWLMNRTVMPLGLLVGAVLTVILGAWWFLIVAWAALIPVISVRFWWSRENPGFLVLVIFLLFMAGWLGVVVIRGPENTEHVTGLGLALFFAALFSGAFLGIPPVVEMMRSRLRKGTGTIAIESAIIIGRDRVPLAQRDPERLSTIGVGDAVLAASRLRAERVVVGLGGSLTVDGGIGMASAFGFRFLNSRGEELPPIGASLERIARVEPPRKHTRAWRSWERLRNGMVVGACDVMVPLVGPRGAARGYAQQKGATPEGIERLERGLENLRQRCVEAGLIGSASLECPGDGAAGGLGFGIRAFLGGSLVSGARLIGDWCGIDRGIEMADLIMTGEGSVDRQTVEGKLPAEVLVRASSRGKPVLVACGRALPDTRTMQENLSEFARQRCASTVGGSHGVRVWVSSLVDQIGGDGTMAERFAADLLTEVSCEATKQAVAARRRGQILWDSRPPSGPIGGGDDNPKSGESGDGKGNEGVGGVG